MKKLIITALPVMLCACQMPPQSNTPVTTYSPPIIQPSRPALQSQQLWMEGVMRADTPFPVAVIRADSDRLTFNWNGDAVELLNGLARARGLVFSFTGVRLPLPVDIEVQGVTYANVIRIIEMQTGWRASLNTYPGQMVLQFMPTIPPASAKHVKGAKR